MILKELSWYLSEPPAPAPPCRVGIDFLGVDPDAFRTICAAMGAAADVAIDCGSGSETRVGTWRYVELHSGRAGSSSPPLKITRKGALRRLRRYLRKVGCPPGTHITLRGDDFTSGKRQAIWAWGITQNPRRVNPTPNLLRSDALMLWVDSTGQS